MPDPLLGICEFDEVHWYLLLGMRCHRSIEPIWHQGDDVVLTLPQNSLLLQKVRH